MSVSGPTATESPGELKKHHRCLILTLQVWVKETLRSLYKRSLGVSEAHRPGDHSATLPNIGLSALWGPSVSALTEIYPFLPGSFFFWWAPAEPGVNHQHVWGSWDQGGDVRRYRRSFLFPCLMAQCYSSLFTAMLINSLMGFLVF